MNCLKIEDIYGYLENELPAELRKQVEEHLKSCSGCQRLVEDRKVYLESLSSLPDYHLPEDFTERVLSNLPDLRSPAKVWLALAGGLYLLFSLFVVILVIGIKSSLFPIILQIFKNIFHIATSLSQFIFQVFQLALGLFKAIQVFLETVGGFLKEFLPEKSEALMTLIVTILISLAVSWFLIKSIQSSQRRENHEK